MNATNRQRSRSRILLASAVLAVLASTRTTRAEDQGPEWNNPNGGNWNSSGNWDTEDIPPFNHAVPDSDDSTAFNLDHEFTCTVYLSGDGQAGSLDVFEPGQITLDLRGHTLNITTDANFYGTQSVESTSGIGNVVVNGAVWANLGTLYLSNLNLTSTGSVDASEAGVHGTLSLGNSQLNSWSLAGDTVNLLNGTLTSNASITIGGTLQGLGYVRPGTTFYNNGTISTTNGDTLTVQPAAGGHADLDGSNERGVVLANQGSFHLAGALNDPVDSRVTVTAPYSATSDSGWVMGGTSTLTLIGGAYGSGDVATFSAGAGSSVLSAAVNASGCCVISGPTQFYPLSDVSVASGGYLVIDGPTTFRGGTVTGAGNLYHNGNIDVAENTTIATANYYWNSVPSFITKNGTPSLTIEPGKTFTINSAIPVAHSGTITVGSGATLIVAGILPMTNNGVLMLNGGGVVADSLSVGSFTGIGATSTSWLRINRLLGIPNHFGFAGSIAWGQKNGATTAFQTMGAGHALTVGADLTVGYDKPATLTISGGGTVTCNNAYLGYTTGGVGTVIVDGEGSLWTIPSALYVGEAAAGINGAGNVTVSNGGDVNLLNNRIGVMPGSTGTFTVTGANSTVTHTGASSLTIGSASGSAGTLNVDSSAIYSTGLATTTINKTGTVSINGGVFNAGANVTVDGGKLIRAATGEFNLSAGKSLTIQNGGSGSFTGTYYHDSASATVTGAGSVWNVSDILYAARLADASLTITNGGAVTTGAAYLGRYTGSHGTVAINGANAHWTNTGGMYVGGSDTAAQGNATITLGSSGNPGGTLTVNGTLTNWATGTINVGSSGQLVTGAMLNHGRLLATGGSASLGNLDGTGTTSVTGPATLTAARVRQSQLAIASASGVPGLVSIIPNGSSNQVSIVNSLSIDNPGGGSAQGKLDLSNNDLIIDYTGASPASAVRALLASGYNNGAWNGRGIASSLADARHGLGYVEASTLNVGSFDGQSVDQTAVLVGYTFTGDANLDGVVSTADFNRLATHFNSATQLWSDGDFNYDGRINAMDFNAIATNFGQTMPSQSLGAVVPEPIAGILLALAWLPRRRGRGRSNGETQ